MSSINSNTELIAKIKNTNVSESNLKSKEVILYALEQLFNIANPEIYLLDIEEIFYVERKSSATLHCIPNATVEVQATLFLAIIVDYIYDSKYLITYDGQYKDGSEFTYNGWRTVFKTEIEALKYQVLYKHLKSRLVKAQDGTFFQVEIYKNDYRYDKESGIKGIEY